ncbi:aspartate 1-decarboxylase [Bradyrhizobium sp. SSUT112]|nr:aspartate 1-decarboxylase [Bradyrhizobium sp. SSUT112]MDH2356847.1 aspartate 1-decarboxylase [Bradyrhizobium sp. SSUT112]
MLDAAGFLRNEHVEILLRGARFCTYVIEAPAGLGVVGLNGTAARLAIPGDKLIIVASATFNDKRRRERSDRVS